MGTETRPRFAPILALGVLVVLMAALASGAHDGLRWQDPAPASDSRTDPGTSDDRPPPEETGQRAPLPSGPTLPSNEPSPWLVGLLLVVALSTVGIVVLAILAAIFLSVVRRRRLAGDIGARAGVTSTPREEADDLPDTLPAQLRRGLDDIAQGPPRNAIVAAWLRLEGATLTEQLPRRLADTPTEFVERALTAYGLDEQPIRRLATLYEEARFSRHPVTEEHRLEARACLERLLAGLGVSR
ncbi:DUF4129 domain-containing protein [Nocardioides limicola]|uniref:DUF4129 domain-containing protein n=1 Tax=Nocardioides limicola TaxID=2803368 RepID=UPI00193BD7D0|nr:DUF4129 domain-containing protein [Nocardioides sp. DJM-14]